MFSADNKKNKLKIDPVKLASKDSSSQSNKISKKFGLKISKSLDSIKRSEKNNTLCSTSFVNALAVLSDLSLDSLYQEIDIANTQRSIYPNEFMINTSDKTVHKSFNLKYSKKRKILNQSKDLFKSKQKSSSSNQIIHNNKKKNRTKLFTASINPKSSTSIFCFDNTRDSSNNKTKFNFVDNLHTDLKFISNKKCDFNKKRINKIIKGIKLSNHSNTASNFSKNQNYQSKSVNNISFDKFDNRKCKKIYECKNQISKPEFPTILSCKEHKPIKKYPTKQKYAILDKIKHKETTNKYRNNCYFKKKCNINFSKDEKLDILNHSTTYLNSMSSSQSFEKEEKYSSCNNIPDKIKSFNVSKLINNLLYYKKKALDIITKTYIKRESKRLNEKINNYIYLKKIIRTII
ncbi:hypothetical protein EDEG_02522 [Edhazardia aedis USNM 41457]|uniref:Uncharacterized protein n=1 Tax=Edhazardia aedis (strain USNM 41457) TaxID=1003232 RepID=J9DKI4_EDHAE|nr:hypothetical protein EDEG_02522 [Edhazardia aedis USNM 41457]|eukprot:EJW03095.1 hypothetical protein EDEG_02522 [Edhazardia aedis USNM 41457]